jgi:hypothetical protein
LRHGSRALGVAYDHWTLFNVGQIPASYDFYLRIDHGDDYLTPIPARLRPTVFYVTDTHLPYSWRKIRHAARWYDLVCCAQRDAAARLPRAAWLPFACDPDVSAPCGMSPTSEVAFVGMDGGIPRKFYLQALRERYPSSVIGMADHTQLGTIYSRARIGFNYSIADEVNMRMFEVLSAGALLVTNRLSHDAFETLGFLDGTHFVSYRSPSDLFHVVDTFLADERHRAQIARRGRTFVHECHTYPHRLRQLLQIAREQLGVTMTAAQRACP